MEQRPDFPFEDFLGEITDGDLIGYARPRDVVEDPELSLARKRELLAYWASDIHAIPNFPALRSLSFGSTVTIDDIQAALRKLDELAPPMVRPSVRGFGVPGI
jgi:hypothetical protein